MEPEWYKPKTVQDALDRRIAHGEDALFVAGGTFLMLLMRTGLLYPEMLINLRTIPGLDTIAVTDQGLRLGPLVSHRQVEQSLLVRQHWPLLAQTFSKVASPRIRNQATVGGVLADADYASDPPAALVALQARVVLQRHNGSVREVPVESLIVGHYETLIQLDEMIVAIVVPPSPGMGQYLKFRTRSSEDRPCVGVAATIRVDDDNHVEELRVVVGAVADRPQYFPDLCSSLRGAPLGDEAIAGIAEAYADRIDPISDIRGSAAYRTRVTRALVARTLAEVAR